MYIGVNNIAHQISDCFIGVNNVARKIKTAYVGDANGKARLVWEAVKKKLLSIAATTTIGTVNDSLSVLSTHCAYKNNENHMLVGAYVSGANAINNIYLYNFQNFLNISLFLNYLYCYGCKW